MKIRKIEATAKQRKKRVAAYCRVSTGRMDQEDSLEIQQATYEQYIRFNPDWEFAGLYADSRSGLNAEKRPGFMKMIADAKQGKIDMILCKSISRLSRNIVECQRYTELLRSKNITVMFEKEKLRTDEPTSNLIFSLMCAIAQDESRSISENVRWGYKERYKRGEYNLGNNRILGYDCVDGKLVPNRCADAISFIYQMYLEGRSIEAIRRLLTECGVLTKKGTPISHNDILYILKNETYKGDKLLQKTHPRDLITKKPDPTVPYESKYLENDHEAIVSVDMWDAVQQKLNKNKELENAVGYRGGQPHSLYGKVFCGECGAPMTRRTVNGVGGIKYKTWICRENRNRKRCKCRNVKEEELLAVVGENEDVKMYVFDCEIAVAK